MLYLLNCFKASVIIRFMSQFTELKEMIACSLYLCPCTEVELSKRDFLKTTSFYGIQRITMLLEKDAIYYKGDTLHIYKSWAKKNLKGYDLDFTTNKEKHQRESTDFSKYVDGL